MNNSEILKLIKVKELEIKKLQLEIDKLKKQFNEITTNSSEDISSREDSVKIFMNYFKGRNDVYLIYLLIKIIQILNIIYLHVQMNGKMVYVIKQWEKNVKIVNIGKINQYQKKLSISICMEIIQ